MFLTLLLSVAFAQTDAQLEAASRAQSAYERKHINDGWLDIVAGAYRSELNIRLRDYRLSVASVQLLGFKRDSDAFARPGKRMRITLSDGTPCIRYAESCGREYAWKLYCARGQERVYSEGGC